MMYAAAFVLGALLSWLWWRWKLHNLPIHIRVHIRELRDLEKEIERKLEDGKQMARETKGKIIAICCGRCGAIHWAPTIEEAVRQNDVHQENVHCGS